MTDRDRQVIEFIQNSPCRSDLIIRLFYPSYRVGTRRLNKLVELGYCKRTRESTTDRYFYFCGRQPKQLDHMDLIARSQLWLIQKGYTIERFKREVKLNGVRPDALIVISKGSKTGVLMLEVERYNNRLPKKIDKYIDILNSKELGKFKILYVCNTNISNNSIDIINIQRDVISSI